mmetsp:Transcript_48794/g.90461  ORF Transcript_48794/g.90461 Transcript_48794/m.90461 type:complete len:414 (-) Transcript_48794:56-1297(-)
MTFSTQLRDRSALQQARMDAMRNFLLDMSAAEAAHAKCLNKAASRLQDFLSSSKQNIQKGMPDDPSQQMENFSEVLHAANTKARAAATHSKNATQSYLDAANELRTLISDYKNDSQAAIAKVSNSVKGVQAAESRLESARAAVEKARASSGDLDSDPWLTELSQQCATDDLMGSMRQHKVQLQHAIRDVRECEATSKKRFLDAVSNGLSQARQQSDNSSAALQQAYLFVRGFDFSRGDDNPWLSNAASESIAKVQSALDAIQENSQNALANADIVIHGMVDRPGIKNLMWSKQYAVVTTTGYVHLFDQSAACIKEEALPHLKAMPCSSLSLCGCTVALANHNPTSLKVEVTAHSKLLPSTKYTLKLGSEEEVVEWTVALKDHVPKDSVWAERIQRSEDTENTKFLQKQKRGGC